MSERRLLVLIALLLGLLGALLILIRLVEGPGRGQEFLDWLVRQGVAVVLALIAVVGSLMIFGGAYRLGGILNLVIGIAIVIVSDDIAGLLVVFSGVLGLVAATVPYPSPR